jgi:hypothetical protein
MNEALVLSIRCAAAGAALVALVVLESCGGGGVVGSGGTGAPDTGYSVGTVSGFGSVIVDGVAFDDLHARIVSETAPGVDSPAEVRLGERVAVASTQAGVASRIRIETALSGPVASAPSKGRFTLLGQTVTINAASGMGPTTQFGGGYLRASDIAVGDSVDVNGLLVQQGSTWIVSATRIDKLPAPPAYLRVTGVVAALAGSTSFVLGDLAVDAGGATLLPTGSMLANGQAVTVLALPAAYVASGAGAPRLLAAQVRMASLQPSSVEGYLSGSISALDTTGKTFSLGAQRVSYSGATFSPAGAVPANGSYVQVRGTVGSDGTLVATSVDVRDSRTEDDSELSGNIVAFDSVAKTFTVRGVSVDASVATLQGCPAAGLANGLYVHVTGMLASSGVAATSVRCQSEPAGSTVERQGAASGVDAATRTFVLAPSRGATVTVQWTDTTFFGNGLTPVTLSGKTVQVEGSFVGTTLVATKIKIDD